MKTVNLTEAAVDDFPAQIKELCGQDVRTCYQCGKCTAGCPVAFAMDYGPRRIMRMVQLGLKEMALTSTTIWTCASCATCTARCPRDIDIAGVMDALRILALREGAKVPEGAVPLFNRTFLDTLSRYGRLFELELILRFNLGSRQPFKDATLGPKMALKGKLGFLPSRIKGRDAIRRLFAASPWKGGEEK